MFSCRCTQDDACFADVSAHACSHTKVTNYLTDRQTRRPSISGGQVRWPAGTLRTLAKEKELLSHTRHVCPGKHLTSNLYPKLKPETHSDARRLGQALVLLLHSEALSLPIPRNFSALSLPIPDRHNLVFRYKSCTHHELHGESKIKKRFFFWTCYLAMYNIQYKIYTYRVWMKCGSSHFTNYKQEISLLLFFWTLLSVDGNIT